jgi:cation diffusion facilitator family transporter
MTETKNSITKYIRIAAITALIGNAVLAVLKICAGLIAQSGALVGDGIDSSTDVLISIVTLAVVKIIEKPADAEHPWGHKRAETVATISLSFLIFFAGAQLIINSISKLISGEQSYAPSYIAFAVTFISIAGKALLAWNQRLLGKRTGSAMLKANAANMASDVLISLGVLVGFVISTITGWNKIDAIIAALIGAWIIKTATGIFKETNLELMDGSSDIGPYRSIVDAVDSVDGASNPHHARIRSIGGFLDIDLDIDIDPQCTVYKAHKIASNVEREIRRRCENVFHVTIHMEPRGDRAIESFGLSEEEMRNGIAQ